MYSSNFPEFLKAMETAIFTTDNSIRQNAQSQILQYRDSNPSQFFLDCSSIIGSQNYRKQIRQSAGTIASRCLNMKNNNNGKYYWDQVYPQQKTQIKQNVLAVLISPIPQVMRAAASIIAVIASIELPKNEWDAIVDILAQNCTSKQPNIKNASITTLGYICEQIKFSGQLINHRLSEQILGSIILGARQQQTSYIYTSLRALENSLTFLQSLMHEPKYRDTVFQVFTNNFRNGIELQATYSALYEFAKVSSPYLINYIKPLSDLTEVHLQRRDNVSVLNLELWQVIGSDHAQKMASMIERVGEQRAEQNFLQAVANQLLPFIMKCLLILNKDEADDEDLRMSAARALEAFTKVCDRHVVDTITNSVATIINSQDPNHQQATVILFSTICEYPDRNLIRDIFSAGFQHLFALLNSTNKIVVKNSLIGFVRLAECLPQVFLLHPNISEIVTTVMDFVQVDIKDIRFIAVQILSNMSEGLKESPLPVSDDPNILLTKIVKYYAQMMKKLHSEQTQMNEKVISIIMNIVMNTNKRDVIVQLIEFMIEEYYKVNNSNQMGNIEFLVQQILSVLHTSILAHKNAIPNNDILGKICDLVNYHIQKYGIEAEGLSLLGALATTFNRSFELRAQHYWPTVRSGLERVNQMATFKATLACIGDFARMMESSFFNNATTVMKQLLQYINGNLDRDIKLCIICCMGDLILAIQDYATNFMDELLKICDICFQAVYELTNSEKDIQYVQELKSNLIEMYSCIVFAANAKKANRKLFDHYGNLATFIVRTCDKNVHPTVEYLKNSLYLLHDSAAFYWGTSEFQQTIRDITESKEVGQLVTLISRYKERSDIKELLDFIGARRNV